MRGNHIHWGRMDYTEPSPLSSVDLASVAECDVALLEGTKTWHVVRRCGQVIGYVTTRCGGQSYRTSEMECWMPAASDWNRSDPAHAHAVLKLLRRIEATRLAA